MVPAPAPPTRRPLAAPVSAANDTAEREPEADTATAAMRATGALARSRPAPHPIATDPRTRRPARRGPTPLNLWAKVNQNGAAGRYCSGENDAFAKRRRLVLSRHT